MSVVYALQVETTGPVKIGFTSSAGVSHRMCQLQAASPYELRWIAAWPGAKADEASAHAELDDYRVRSEWFHPVKPVFDLIERYCPDFDQETFEERVFCRSSLQEIRDLIRGFDNEAHSLVVDAIGYHGAYYYRWTMKGYAIPAEAIARGVDMARAINSGRVHVPSMAEGRRLRREREEARIRAMSAAPATLAEATT